MRKTLIWIGSVIGAASVLALAYAYLIQPAQVRAIAVVGECLTSAPKDRTAITLRVRSLNKNAAASMKLAAEKMAEITAFLKKQDVEMQTTQFDSYIKTEWDDKLRKSVELGVETNIAVEISAKKIENIEAILTKFAGTENVFSENLRMFASAETLKPIMEKCLGDAVLNARERATAIAISERRKLGRMLSAEYGGGANIGNIRPANFLTRAKMESAAFDMSGGLVSKDAEVSITINAVFEIK
ncbi:MAG: SIMPL domain-containing protein [Rickettsiales bacterium]|jgi:uncharacterized protein YggE|nr:SIMPL domain-containing protein [Rickettsiales bacterium]